MADFIQVPADSDSVALVCGDEEVSFGDLSARVSVLARELIGRGVGPETAVAVCMDRSVEMVIAVHAVVAAGGQYVPVDPDLPADRAGYMLDTAGTGLALVRPGDLPPALRGHEARVTTVTVDARTAVDAAVAPVTDAERLAPLHPDHAVYTLFTSGSTGRPKGVTVTHRALMNLLDWFDGVVGEVTDPVIMLKTPYTFDVSVPELFWPLLRGAPTVIAEPDGHRDPAYLRDLIRDTNVSIIQFVPSMLSVFLDELGDVASALASVQRVHIAGEALPPAVAAAVFDAIPHARAFNHYGPTEDTVYATTAVLSPDDDRVTIGEPVTNTATYILDRRLRMVPRGVPGELYLGGAQVARGYAAQPALTAERFIADPFAETAGERLYRTGDLVRWNSGGQIEYLGRTDFQVKLRGQRIELGEIEAVLAAAPGVVKAAATVVTAPGGADHLVAYLSPATADADAVRASLEQTLPSYMVPTMWTVLDDIALNTAGKVDRRALPAPDFGTLAGEYVAPATPAEAALADVFADVLGLDRVSVTESFFDVGGNSLSAMRLAARAADALSVAVSVREVFEAPSVRELAAAVAENEAALPPVTAAQPRPDRIPLSFAQQRMWFLNQFEPGGATYNIPSVLRVTGDLDVAALHAAVVDVVTRHEVLRTTFPADAGVPAQVISDPDRVADEPGVWAVVDTEAELTAAVTTGFDVTAQWPLRVRLWPIGEREFVLATVVHHIAADGESMAPLITDLVAAYAARSAGRAPEFAPLDVQFADFAIWQHEALGAPDDADSVVGRQLAYWRDQLAGAPEVLDLPMDRPRPAVASHRGGTHGFVIGEQVGEQILAAARAAGVTPFMLVHAALAAYLGRLSATDDISIATPIAGRGQSALDPLIGMFVNTLVLRTRLDSGAPFTELLTQVRQTDLAAFAHSDAPFETVVEAVDPVRSEAFGPLAQVILLVGDGAPEELSAEVAGVRVEAAGALDLPAQYDLHVNVAVEPGQDWTASLIYAADLFDEATAATMAARFVRVLETVTADLSVPVGDVLQLTDAERADLLAGSQRRPAPAGESLVAAIAARAAADPARRAVVGDGVEYSYGELVRRADALAAALAERGVGTDDVVVLALERSVHWVAGMLAAWKVGAAYAPVDPTGPVRRIEALVTDTGAAALLGRPEWLAEQGIGDDFAGAAVLPVSDAPVGEVPALPLPQGRADRLAYVISTSGSTGRPKPTMVPMGGVENTVGWYREQLALSAGEGVLIASAPTFDLTQKNVWAGLASGATLHLADAMFDPRQILAVVAAESIAVMNTAPSAFEAIVDADETGALAALRVLFLGGEVVKLAPLRALIDGGLRVVNSYGPTEACDVVSFHEVTADERGVVPIGRAVPGVDLYVLTDRLAPAPVGVPGELYIGGIAVGRGYGAMAGQTADRFVADPFATDGSRLYRTGDLVRWTADGELDYLGRTDFQIKLRGLRIELGEIESVLAQVPGVDRAAAVVATGPDGGEHLVAYVSPGDVDLDAIKTAAYAELPGYMVPTVWTVVDDIALSPSGKVDRQALPPAEFAAVRAEYVAPETEAETAVAAVFAEILGVDRVSVTERFFDLGGNSLSAMRLAARAEQALGASISVRDVFEAPTVRGLAAVAANADRSAGQIPLTFGQQRLWFDNQLGAGTGRANLALTLQLAGPLDLTALHRAVLDVTARQGALRTTFPTADGMPYQAIDDAETAAPRIDWAVAASQAEVDDAVHARFDLTADYPFRVRVLTEGPGEHAVTLVAHPIVADSRSWLPLAADLVAAYDARRDGAEPTPAPLPLEYADYARWQHRELGAAEDPTSPVGAQLDYWTGALAGLPETTGLPTDRPRPAVASGRGAVVRTSLPATTVAGIRAAAGAHETGEFTVVHTALAVLLSRLGAGTDLAIGTPTTGRVRPELDALVGAFDNMVVLRSRLDDDASFDDLLAATAAVEAEAFGRADVPFETVVDAVAPVRSTAFASLAQVWLTLDASLLPETFDPAPLAGEAAGLTVSPGPRRDVGSRADLLISVDSGAADWTVEVRYATDLYDESTAIRFGDRLVRLLAALLADTAAPVAGAAMDAPAAAAAVELDPHPLPMTAPTSDAVLFAGTGTAAVTLADLLAASVERHGPRPAVADPDGRLLTYAQLDTAADALARTLIARGIGAETTVVVVADRSAALLTAIWAIAKTGGAYLAVDPATPADRIADAARTCGAVLGLAATAADVPDATELPWLRLDDESIAGDATAPSAAEPVRPARIGNTAYVSLTADGRRAVAVTHAGVANLAAEQSRRAGVDEYCRVLGHAAPSSAAFTGEYLLAATAGATLVFGPDSDGDALAEFMMRQGITHALLSPTVLATLDPATLHSLRVVYAGGDELTVELKDQWALMRRIQNVYGTAETTGAVTISEPLPLGATVDLGGPVDGVGLLVLDDRLAPVAPDTDGDLYVVGGALARGYLGQAGLTADRFVANPFGTAGQRMFRTGDVVRRRTGDLGQTVLEYVGRRADRPATAPGEDAALAAGAGAPANVAEERVAAIVADLLGSDRVSLTESFLALGGNPLLASRAAARISEALGASVTMGAVLEAESLRALVGSVDTRGAALPPVTAVVPRPDVIPLSFAQQRMWFINQFEPSLGTYNIPSVVRLSGALDVDAMRAAFADVLARHEVLRTTFPSVDGRPVQQIAPVESIADQLDWAVVDSQRAVEEAVTGGFDVARQWPIRVRLWPMNADGTEHVLAVVVHHIAADGESTGPLLTDVVLAYLARAAGHAPEFAPLEVQFADFALWQHTELGSPDDPASVVGGQLRYWARQLAGLPDVLDLPADRPRPLVASQEGASVGFEIPAEVAARVAALAADRGLSAFMVVHAALAAVLTRLSATDDVAVSTPVAGRGQRVLDPLVGMFVNTLILRTEVTPSTTFDELLEQVRTTDLDAMSHADVPFESIVDALKPTRSEAFAPLAQVMLTFDQSTLPELNTGGDTIDLGGLTISPVDPPEPPAKGDLTIGVSVADGGQPWPGVMVYATDLFDEATVRRFGERLVTVLSEVVVAPGTPVYDVVLTSPEEEALIEGWGTGQSVQIECETVVSGMEELR